MGQGIKIALAGEGGQGVQSVAMILTDAAYAMGKEALYIPNFGVEQRGGVSVAFVQIAAEKIGSPKFKTADIVVALSDRSVRRTTMYCGEETLFFYDDNIENITDDLPQTSKKIVGIPAIKIAQEELHPRVFNVVVMGALIGATGVVTEEKAKEALENRLGYKFEQKPELREMNFKALQRGMEIVKEVM